MMEQFKNLPVEFLFVFIAFFGGIARYLNSYANGAPFKLGIFLASGVVAGFSGWMFALFGKTMELPTEMLYIMAGTGGWSGEQTMKYVIEQLSERKKVKSE